MVIDTENAGVLVRQRSPAKERVNMKVKILSGTVALRKRREPDEIVDLPKSEARLLINIGKAELIEVEVPAPGGGPNPENREDDLGEKVSTKEAVEAMTALGDDKDAIEAFALKNFGIDLNKSYKPENMIKEFEKKVADTAEND